MPIVLFIMGTPRAGTTWLNSVLGSHSWAANFGEYYRPFLIPGHVACRWCEAQGLPECTVLHGIENVPADDAFTFAAERTGKPVLVDCSKDIDWSARFLGRDDLDVRFVHIVRHPCGVVESQSRRRSDASLDDLLAEWQSWNAGTTAFIARSGRPSVLVSYEELADDPLSGLPAVTALVGRAFEPPALRYWDFPHHGLGGNGAASLYLRRFPQPTIETGDDVFYEELASGREGADRRWKERLPRAFINRAVSTPYARGLASRLGVRWEI